jgi:PucR C-terminal helix-turn-helix domain
MTSLLAKGTEWPLFIQRMADQIDGAIMLYDDSLAVRGLFASQSFDAQSSGLRAGKINPTTLSNAISQSRGSGRSIVLLDAGDEHYRVMALLGGAGRGESLVICHRGELDPIDIRNLERSTVALSIAKLWSEKRETEQLIASTTLLRHLIFVDPPDMSTVAAVRERLNINSNQPVMLALITISGLDRAAQTAVIRASAANMNLLVDLINDTYLAVGPEKSIRAFLQTLMRRRDGWEIGGVVSDAFADLIQAAVHYGRIEPALRVLRKMSRLTRFVDYSQVNLFAKLFEAGDASRIAGYLTQTLSPIDQRDRRHKTQLKKTLLCYMDNQHNVARTAELLGVHINTLRQRLGTLREVTGGWDDPVAALELHVALRLDSIIAAR